MTPAAVQKARGNPGRRPVATAPIAAASGELVMGDARAPAWLSDTGREIWAHVTPDLRATNLLKRPDELAFGRYCDMFALWLKADEALKTQDLVKETTSEHVTMDRLNKHLQALLLLNRALTDFEEKYGLNPSARQRIWAQRAAGNLPNVPGELPLEAEPAEAEAPLTGFLN